MKKNIEQIVAELIREQLLQGNEVKLENLGTFKLKHQSARKTEQDDGRVVLLPPREKLHFEPNSPSQEG